MPIVLGSPPAGSGLQTQQLIFDPTDEGTGTELDVMASPFRLMSLEVPAPPPEFSWAGSMDTEGEDPAGRKHQNRRVSMTVDIIAGSLTDRDQALADLAGKAAKVFAHGGTLRHVAESGEYRTLDLLAADSYEPQFDVKYDVGTAATVTLGFVAKPYARGEEVDTGTNSETSLGALVFTETGILGDVPGLGRLVIEDDSSNNQRWAVWGIEADQLDTTTGLYHEAEDVPDGPHTAVVADGGSSAGNLLRFTAPASDIPNIWYETFATLRGTYRVLVRAKTSSAANTIRIRVDTFDGTTYGNYVTLAGGTTYGIYDLGIVKADEPLMESWTVLIGAPGSATGTIDLDWVLLVPVAEGSGVISPVSSGSPYLANGTGRYLHVRHDAVMYGTADRSDPAGGLNYYRVPKYEGDYLKVPVSGPDRAVRVVVKMARYSSYSADFTADVGIDDITASLFYTPRYLSVI